jgi:pimeloyl-ACP methyl ester carboxylesterase
VTSHAANGWLTLNIEPHDVLPDQPKAYYDALPESLKHYQSIGQDDRDKSYFLQMYLADYRAVDYMTHRDDWDGKTLVVMGTSMGGQQSLCVAGLHPKITHVIVNEPAGCDTNGPLHGRQSGYPNFPAKDPGVMETALYFDAVNFAPRIHAKCLVAMGFVDTIAPPAGIWTAFNQIPGPKQAVPMIDSPHNNLATPKQQEPFTSTSSQWLATLAKGGDVNPEQPTSKPSAPTFDDHQNMMDQLGIRALRAGPDPKNQGSFDLFNGESIRIEHAGCADEQRWHKGDARGSMASSTRRNRRGFRARGLRKDPRERSKGELGSDQHLARRERRRAHGHADAHWPRRQFGISATLGGD